MGYYDPSLVTETQDPVNLEMAAYNSVISKEDFGIITTTQEGILNSLHMMSDEIGKQTRRNEQNYVAKNYAGEKTRLMLHLWRTRSLFAGLPYKGKQPGLDFQSEYLLQ